MKEIVIVVREAAPGRFSAFLDSEKIVKSSKTPFCTAARVLVERGYPADATLIMRHGGSKTDALRAPLGKAAMLTVVELKAGGPPRFARWSPFEAE